MKTYNDLLAVGNAKRNQLDFVRQCIEQYKSDQMYRDAMLADEYYRRMNRTITNYKKLLYTVRGEAVPDNYSANYKMVSGDFQRIVMQECQYLLGNGVTWKNQRTRDTLGDKFDTQLQKAAKYAVVGGFAFGFWNYDHMDVFSALEFAPLYDEDNGALMAGVRWWQVAPDKPMRATLYEIDGYTDYIWRKNKGEILHEKRGYIERAVSTPVDATTIYEYQNYPTFPIVPLFGNPEHQTALAGIQSQIDCYDLIKSGFANDLDDASQIYWIIQNAGGMDEVDLQTFLNKIKRTHAANLEDTGAQAEAHTLEVPYAAREAILDRIHRDLYRDAMALDVENIANGATTATQIRAAYEPLNSKCDEFEYCVHEFLDGILAVAGINDEKPTFTRSMIINVAEDVQTIIQAANYLDSEYVTRKIMTLLGDGDQVDEVLDRMDEENAERMMSLEKQIEQLKQNKDNGETEENQTEEAEEDQQEK